MGSTPLLRISDAPGNAVLLRPNVLRPPSPEAALLAQGAVGADTLAAAEGAARLCQQPIDQILLRSGAVSPGALSRAQAASLGTRALRRDELAADPRLIDKVGTAWCLRHALLPLRRLGGNTLIATARPDSLHDQQDLLPDSFGTPVFAVCSEADLHAALQAACDPAMSEAAETRVAAADSCRFWYGPGPRLVVSGLLGALTLSILAAPVALMAILTVVALLAMISTMLVKGAALVAQLRHRPAPAPVPLPGQPLPVVSVMVPLLYEENIAEHLVRRLARLRYPRALLDICLVTEAADAVTRATLARTTLPPWMRVITVPDGSLKTKPRALNYALDFCRGDIIGIYDAEDAPDPGQIETVVERFRISGPEVACLQGVLDFYNPDQNWLARCFTMDYASWFRVVLPGLAKLGLVVPLGGTTLFLRRKVIEELGGWDAHNVTEDADLGIRLARRGYRTELIPTVTQEEANCAVWPWIKQRSRWIKGFAMTWSVHSRSPVQLWRELGTRRFAGLQAMFLGSILQYLLTPLLWSFWLLPMGVAHPLDPLLGPGILWAIWALFISAELVNLAVGLYGLNARDKRRHMWWLPTLHFYFPLATLAAFKAVIEMVACPFYWDKTRHGISH